MTAPHPLQPLGQDEMAAACTAVLASGGCGERPAIAYACLAEPPKAQVLAWQAGGGPLPRRAALVVVVDQATGMTHEAAVAMDGDAATVLTCEARPGLHAPLVFPEFETAQNVVNDPLVKAALARRGVTDLSTVYVEPWPAGNFDRPYDGTGRRVGHCVFYLQEKPTDQPWARPIQGLVAVADRDTNEVVELIDERANTPIPGHDGRFDPEGLQAGGLTLRDDIKLLHITQPEGPSFTLDGTELAWQKWRVRLSLHPIEGLVLHQLTYDGRSVLYRGAMAEMVVPYGDPQGQHYWRHVFDEGEVGMGRAANSLVLGCDCLGEIAYLSTPLALPAGTAAVVPNTVCIHEEDVNALWRHHDRNTGTTHSRRNRRLAISFWATLGNYDYGYFWYLYQDGSIEIEVKLTGIVLMSAIAEGHVPSPHEAVISPSHAAPNHQHFFSFRLDLDVDGPANRVSEVDVVADPLGPDNPHGVAFRAVPTLVSSEADGRRRSDAAAGRTWLVSNEASRNALGQAAAYQVVPGPSPLLLAHPQSAAAKRAAFATEHLWVSAYDDAETRAAGFYPNQHPGGAGLPEYLAANRPLVDTDVVLWVTVGVNHVSRPEEFPIMPVERTGFHLRPVSFFDRNPALDVPPQDHIVGQNDTGHCH
ncbi:MAG: primary-amine oxidase [Actinomycetota bacterium]|nr:primary-amine oxidase [Actinomycetota bacterium]